MSGDARKTTPPPIQCQQTGSCLGKERGLGCTCAAQFSQTTIEQLRALTGPAPLNDASIAEVTEHMADELFLAWYKEQSPEEIARLRAELDTLPGERK